ncbi:pH-response regulator protein palH/rim21 [Oleoguttula sp. CCFEE 5521]
MAPSPGNVIARQLWNLPSTRSISSWAAQCTPFTLPSNGVISMADTILTLTADAVFQPECTSGALSSKGIDEPSSIADLQDPFYASTTPQTYVIAAATVIAWILVFMLVITPRTSFFGTPVVHSGLGGGRGIIGGANGGGGSLIGVGSRPWLQKVAAFTVAVSLTIATADTFKVLERQYLNGYMDATQMREEVMGSLEIRITRVISDIFLWLAQVQTLIRLFPRHKEKVLIKWIGFAMIICDSIFSCLNSFLVNTATRPRHFVDAIPALSYLFELALGLLYAAWVMYYTATKRRYAFYHAKMRSISLIAVLSLVAILTPVVFFVTDVSNADVAGWGDYFRWVGAAAASVIVWEWVERIEALERDEKKDGILGREIFDGDEMLDVDPTDDVMFGSGRRGMARMRRARDGTGEKPADPPVSALEKGLAGFAKRFRKPQQPAPKHFPLGRAHSHITDLTEKPAQPANANGNIAFGRLPKPGDDLTHENGIQTGIIPPPAVASPPIRRRIVTSTTAQDRSSDLTKPLNDTEDDARPNRDRQTSLWHTVPNPFKRKRASPPAEVQKARAAAIANGARALTPAHNFSKWHVKNRLGALAAETGERFRDRTAQRPPAEDLPVTVIPAQPRGSGRTWSPELPRQPAVQREAPSAAVTASEHSPGDLSNATTLTNNTALPRSASANAPTPAPQPSRNSTVSPFGAGGTALRSSATPTFRPNLLERRSTAERRSPQQPPPRADDISPVAGSKEVVVVPAPRRSPLRM